MTLDLISVRNDKSTDNGFGGGFFAFALFGDLDHAQMLSQTFLTSLRIAGLHENEF
ncbi:hypothetical protein GCM10022221_22330 [Actinocorallia aurea]